MPGKTEKAERIKRVDAVFDLLIAGARRRDIIEYAQKNNWGVVPATIDTYIRSANDKLIQESQANREQELGRAINRLHNLYARASRVNDFRTALAAQRELSLLLGLHAPTRQVLTGPDNTPISIVFSKVSQPTDE